MTAALRLEPTQDFAALALPALAIDGLRAGYAGKPILDNLALPAIAPGTVTALIGPNAAGKSTLMRAIAGLIKGTTGSVRLGDLALNRLSLSERARHVRFVPQSYATQARLTVFDLLLVARMTGSGGRPAQGDLAAVDTALGRVGIAHLADRFAYALSGGQQQLVALAQALTRPAPVLLLDEPTSALDLRNQLEAITVMTRVAREDRAIVIVALHDLNLAARHADRIILLDNGRIAADGAPHAVIASPSCAHAYGVQLATEVTRRGALAIEAYL